MKIQKMLGAICIGLVLTCHGYGASSADTTDPQIEKMKLENERMKLENEKLKLQIERDKLKTKAMSPSKVSKTAPKESEGDGNVVVASPKKYVGMEIGRIRSEASEASQTKAEEIKDAAARVVLDFTNGELWYKGVRSSMNDFPELAKREGWKTKKNVEKRDAHGYARERLSYKNISSCKYEMNRRGVFTWLASGEEGSFAFDTPEGVSSESSYDDFRNTFESAYFTYDRSKTKSGLTWLCFRHRVDFKDWTEKLQFGFDKEGKLARIEWGILDEN